MRSSPFLLLCLLFLTGPLRVPQGESADPLTQQMDRLAEIMTLVVNESGHSVDQGELVEGAINGLLSQLDPHTLYYSEDRYRTMKEDQRGSYYGIGIHIGLENGHLTVIAPIAGTPAAAAGVRAGDQIVAINHDSTTQISIAEAIRRLRGGQGESVWVTLKRLGVHETIDMELVRAEIPAHNVRASFLLDPQTGYISLKDFGETATEEMVNAIQLLESDGMKRLVLDLRGNPGGLLPQAIGVASLFVPGDKVVVSTQGRMNNANQEYRSELRSEVTLMPLIVLIDRGSASASEIVAGAIQDHDRGLIVGVTSWGKGLVQSVFPVGNGSKGLALTTARYYTPSGRNIQGPYDSIDDYYHPKSSEELFFGVRSDGVNRQRFFTIAGREVLQVRGIVPDVYIAYPKNPELVDRLELRHNAFFNFATLNQDRYGRLGRDWQVPDEVLIDFYAFAKDRGFSLSWDQVQEHQVVIKKKLAYQLLHTKDPNEAWRFLMGHDVHIQATVDLFDEAKELLDVYGGKSPLRANYASDLKDYARLHRTTD